MTLAPAAAPLWRRLFASETSATDSRFHSPIEPSCREPGWRTSAFQKRLPAALLVLTVLCYALGISACNSSDSSSDASAAAMPSAQVVTAQRGDISHVLTLAGQFQPYQVVDVHPKVSGYMARINVDIGDVVHKGETLAVLEVPELKAATATDSILSCNRATKKSLMRSTRSIAQKLRTRRFMRSLSD